MSEHAPLSIGVLINNMEGRFQAQILRGIWDFARQHQVHLEVFSGRALGSPYPEDLIHNHVYELSMSRRLSGLLVVAGALGTHLDDSALREVLIPLKRVPMVTVGRVLDGIAGIRTDTRAGVADAVRHLVVDHGYRRLAFLSGPAGDPDSQARLGTFRKVLKSLNVGFDESQLYWGDYSYRCAPAVVERMLRNSRLEFDALVCANDEMAVAIVSALEARGYRTPIDYAVVGVDDVPDLAMRSPLLSTVQQPMYEMTLRAGRHLLALIGRTQPEPLDDLSCPFIRRETCGCSSVPTLRARAANQNTATDAAGLIREITSDAGSDAAVLNDLAQLVPSVVSSLQLDMRSPKDPPLLLQTLHEWLEATFLWERYAEIWHSLASRLEGLALSLAPDDKAKKYVSAVFPLVHTLIARRSEHRNIKRLSALSEKQTLLLGLSRVMAQAHTATAMERVLIEPCRALGISGIQISTTAEFAKEPVYAGPLTVHLPLAGRGQLMGILTLTVTELDASVCSALQDEVVQALYLGQVDQQRQVIEDYRLTVLEERRKSEERYREMAKMVPMVMWETDARVCITYLNQAAESALPLRVGDSLKPLLSAEDRSRLERVDLVGLRLRRPPPRGPLLIVQVSPIHAEGGGTVGLRWHALDPVTVTSDLLFPDQRFFDEHHLTTREREVLLHLVQGFRLKDIAQKYSIAESTIKGHVTHVYDKLGVEDRQSLLARVQDFQVRRHGLGTYLFMVLNHLLAYDADVGTSDHDLSS